MTVYVDVLLLTNCLVNYFMLLGVKVISRSEAKRYRILLGAFLGGATSLTVFWNLGYFATLIKVLTALLMVVISFPYVSCKQYFKKVLWLFIISFLFAGVCFGAYTLFDTDLMIYSNGTVYFDINITFLTVCTVISFLIINIILRFTDKKAPKQQYYNITLLSGGEKIELKGFLDTGNNLKEPFSFSPVIVTNKDIYTKLYKANSKAKERIIPISTVKGSGIMSAFQLDAVYFQNREIHNIYLGCGNSLPENCDVLLCLDLLSEANYEKTKTTF